MYLFFEAKLKSPFRMMQVNTFDSTGCKVIGQKFSGFPPSLFFYANNVSPNFLTSRTVFVFHAVWRLFVIRKRRAVHF